MRKRIIGGAIITLIVVPCFIFGGIAFDLLANVVGLLALLELITVDKELKEIPLFVKIVSLVFVPLIAYSNLKESLYLGVDYSLIAITIISLLLLSIFLYNNKYGAKISLKLAFVTIFAGLIANFYVNIFHLNKWLFLWLVLIAVGTDVFAYLGGRFFGKHKLTKISPNKTIEGAIIGTIVGTVVGYIYYINMFTVTNPIVILIFTILLSVVGQLGDLFFSLIKRENNVKDFSNIIPGHGGICDRIDSLTFIVILFIILLRYF